MTRRGHRKVLGWWCLVAVLTVTVSQSQAKVHHEVITYQHGEVELQGFVAYDDAVKGKRPGVLVVHEWWGLNDYARSRTKQLAAMGYVALAVDMYGHGKATDNAKQAGHWSGEFRGTGLMRSRAKAGLSMLVGHKRVDPTRVAAIGYCFGGTTVLQMAYSGADLRGVVSFHGSLPSPDPGDMQPGRIKASILVCHGADDSFVSAGRVADFKEKLAKTDADWLMVTYGGAKHSFTNPDASARGMDGLAYNANADRRSWQQMQRFFDELFE